MARLTNRDLQTRYAKRLSQAGFRLERATLKLLRAATSLSRVRTETVYLRGKLREIEAALGRHEEYPKPIPPKRKAGRRIEL